MTQIIYTLLKQGFSARRALRSGGNWISKEIGFPMEIGFLKKS
jgi:hypothetical protein